MGYVLDRRAPPGHLLPRAGLKHRRAHGNGSLGSLMQRPLAKPGTGDSLLYRVFCRDEMQSFCIAFLSLQKITSGSRKDTIGNESMTGCGPPGAGRPARRRSIGR